MMLGFGRGIDHFMSFGWIGGICMIVFVAVIIVLIILAVRSGRHGHSCCSNTWHERGISGAEDILKERLAKGEIDEATYEKLLKKIKT